MNIEDRASIADLYEKVGNFDAVVNAAGDVAFAPLAALKPEDFEKSLKSKLMGQVNLVQLAFPHINPKGSFTLVSGILSKEFIAAGSVASLVNRAVEGYAQSAACELPKELRINVVSPSLLKDSETSYGTFFPGFIPVDGWRVAQAYKRSVFGVQTGQIFEVF